MYTHQLTTTYYKLYCINKMECIDLRMSNDKFSINDIIKNNIIPDPSAYALFQGGSLAPDLNGRALFCSLTDGILLKVCVTGIPTYNSEGKPSLFHGLHIHEFENCNIGDPNDPFKTTGGHWNPTNELHPYHYGDLPPLMSSNGIAAMDVYLSRFSIKDIIGKAIIIHENADDFTSQPSGNSGKRLACGIIMPT